MKGTLVALAVILGACASPTMAHRTGARYPALSAGCPVDFVESTSGFDAGGHELLGHVTLSGSDSFTDAAKAELHPTVCEWGGTAVTIVSSAAAMGSKSATFSIHRKRDAAAAPVPLACSGKFVNGDGASILFDGSNTAKMSFAGNEAPCEARGAAGSKVIMTCGAGSQEGAFAADCTSLNLGGLEFAKAQ